MDDQLDWDISCRQSVIPNDYSLDACALTKDHVLHASTFWADYKLYNDSKEKDDTRFQTIGFIFYITNPLKKEITFSFRWRTHVGSVLQNWMLQVTFFFEVIYCMDEQNVYYGSIWTPDINSNWEYQRKLEKYFTVNFYS